MIDTRVSLLSGVLLLDICAFHTLTITNTMFKHKVVYKCIWYYSSLCQRSVIKFVVTSSDLWLYVLNTGVKRAHQMIWQHLSSEEFLVYSTGGWGHEIKLDRGQSIHCRGSCKELWSEGHWCLSWRHYSRLIERKHILTVKPHIQEKKMWIPTWLWSSRPTFYPCSLAG